MAASKTYRDSRRNPIDDDCCETSFESLGAHFPNNAVDEREYEDMRRLPQQQTGMWDNEGNYQTVTSTPPMSQRVSGQVLGSLAAHVGSMTFASQLTPGSRDAGQCAPNDGGVSERAAGACRKMNSLASFPSTVPPSSSSTTAKAKRSR